MEARTLVYYHIPGDNDDPGHPNVYAIMKPPEAIKLRDVRSKFPLPGKYHFRFQLKAENYKLWMDITQDESLVPFVNTHIIAKVLRVSWLNSDIVPPTISAPLAITSNKTVKETPQWNGNVAANEVNKNGTVYAEPIFTPTLDLPVRTNANYVDSTFSNISAKTVAHVEKTNEEDILHLFDSSPAQVPSKSPPVPKDDFDLIFR